MPFAMTGIMGVALVMLKLGVTLTFFGIFGATVARHHYRVERFFKVLFAIGMTLDTVVVCIALWNLPA